MLPAEVTELRERKAEHGRTMRGILDRAQAEQRELNGEEAQEFDRIGTELDNVERQIGRVERVNAVESSTVRTAPVPEVGITPASPEAPEARSLPATRTADSEEYVDAFGAYLRSGSRGMSALTTEQRAALDGLDVGTTTEGGFTVPSAFLAQLQIPLRVFSAVNGLATHFTTASNGPVTIPTVSAFGTVLSAAEKAALDDSATGTDPAIGEVVMNAYKYSHITKISDELVQDSAFDVTSLVATIGGQNLAVTTGADYLVGSGSSKPNGLFHEATVGVTGAVASTNVETDDLISLFYKVLAPYRANGTWIMSDVILAQVRSLKASDSGVYLWTPGLADGSPDTFLGRPVVSDPNVVTPAASSIALGFGDVSKYFIRDVAGPTVRILQERYADTGQIGVKVELRTDGALVDANAFKTLKFGTAS